MYPYYCVKYEKDFYLELFFYRQEDHYEKNTRKILIEVC